MKQQWLISALYIIYEEKSKHYILLVIYPNGAHGSIVG
jgi:hypothetical protein